MEPTALPDVHTTTKRPLVLAALAVVVVVVGIVVVNVIGSIDWSAVGDALGHLDWWQPFALIAVLLVRQFFNALPLAFYIPGIGPFKAFVNDQVGIMMMAVAPPPGDMAIRVGIFRAWGVAIPPALAGVTLNMLTFYIVRFGAPVIGFVLLIVVGEPPGFRYVDLLSIGIAAAILAALLLIIRAERTAIAVGDRTGRVARRFKSSVDPDAWAQWCCGFRADAKARFSYGFPRSIAATVAMLFLDLALLTLSLRFVGLDTTEISVTDIAIAYFFAYPFTVFFFSGLGIVDALIIASLVDLGGPDVEAAAVAGLVVWRVFFIGGPIAFGAICLAFLRPSIRRAQAAADAESDDVADAGPDRP